MKFYLDAEFNGFGGELLSLALVREDGDSIYAVVSPDFRPDATDCDPWVLENVLPILNDVPDGVTVCVCDPSELSSLVAGFLNTSSDPVIVADWPEDIVHLCNALLVGPGRMVNVGRLKFEMERVASYPTTLPGAVRHNAWWDAMALRRRLTGL